MLSKRGSQWSLFLQTNRTLGPCWLLSFLQKKGYLASQHLARHSGHLELLNE